MPDRVDRLINRRVFFTEKVFCFYTFCTVRHETLGMVSAQSIGQWIPVVILHVVLDCSSVWTVIKVTGHDGCKPPEVFLAIDLGSPALQAA